LPKLQEQKTVHAWAVEYRRSDGEVLFSPLPRGFGPQVQVLLLSGLSATQNGGFPYSKGKDHPEDETGA